MSADTAFTACNSIAVAGWILLIGWPRSRWAATVVSGTLLPGVFAVLYVTLVVLHWGETPGGFSSLGAVGQLFTNRWLLLAGWVHYLAFDLFVGAWQARHAERYGIPRLALVPCLLLTFLFGPAGWLLYRGVKGVSQVTR